MGVISTIRESRFFKLISDISVVHWAVTLVPGLGSGVAAIMHGKPLEDVILYFVGTCALGFVAFYAYKKGHHHAANHRVRSGWWLLFPIVAVALLLSVFFYEKPPPVFDGFSSIYSLHKLELGNPIRQVVSDGAYQAWHEHAMVLWIKKLPGFVVLPIGTNDWIGRDDIPWDARLGSDSYVREMLNRPIPEGNFPPSGSLAKLFLQDTDYWMQKVGWRESDCTYEPGLIHFQKFQHGWIMGDFRKRMDMPDGITLVLLDDGKRYPEITADAPVCRNDVPH